MERWGSWCLGTTLLGSHLHHENVHGKRTKTGSKWIRPGTLLNTPEENIDVFLFVLLSHAKNVWLIKNLVSICFTVELEMVLEITLWGNVLTYERDQNLISLSWRASKEGISHNSLAFKGSKLLRVYALHSCLRGLLTEQFRSNRILSLVKSSRYFLRTYHVSDGLLFLRYADIETGNLGKDLNKT